MDLSKARELALRLMRENGLLEKGWWFDFDRAKRRFGCCKYGKKQITLSAYLVSLNTEDQVRETTLHEIAHALVGYKNGHNHVWKSKAKELGCSGNRCYTSSSVAKPPAKYTLYCPNCGVSIQRHRKSHKIQACRMCCEKHNGGRFSFDFILRWKEN